MLEAIGDKVRSTLRHWTETMAGDNLRSGVTALARVENEYGVDPFGFSLDYALAAVAPLLWLYKNYFRVETFGLENVPQGRVLLIANHSGQLPLDASMIGVAMLTEARPPRAVRSMVEKWIPSLPYVSSFMARTGQIVGTPENCRRVLAADETILVFPEGTRGLNKLWSQRYQLQEFGLGFMRLALETKTPIVPIGVVGAEEQSQAIFDLKPVAKAFGWPAMPLTLTGVPLPLPVKYRIYFGEPLTFTGSPDDEDAELDKKVHVVKSGIQALVHRGLKERKHVFW